MATPAQSSGRLISLPPRIYIVQIVASLLWFAFVMGESTRLLVPLLWLPFGVANGRKLWILPAGVIWLAFFVAFWGVSMHPAWRISFWLQWASLSLVGWIALVYTVMHIFPPFVLPLADRALPFRAVVWTGLVLLVEWVVEKITPFPPLFFFSDAGAVFPVNLLTPVYQPWGATFLWSAFTWGGIAFFLYPRITRVIPLVATTALWFFGVQTFPQVRFLDHHVVLFLSPGVQEDAMPEEFATRYILLLEDQDLRQRLQNMLHEDDTLWIVFPEGSFGGKFREQTRSIREHMFSLIKETFSPRPVGLIWHEVVYWGDGKRSRAFVRPPGSEDWYYDKRKLFIVGEIFVPFLSSLLGDVRQPGSMHQSNAFKIQDSAWMYFLTCNEALYPSLMHYSPRGMGIMITQSHLGWLPYGLFTRSVMVRYRLIVASTGIPLCSVFRHGGAVCILPDVYLTTIGNPWVGQPTYLLMRLPTAFFNPIYGKFALWIFLGLSTSLLWVFWRMESVRNHARKSL